MQQCWDVGPPETSSHVCSTDPIPVLSLDPNPSKISVAQFRSNHLAMRDAGHCVRIVAHKNMQRCWVLGRRKQAAMWRHVMVASVSEAILREGRSFAGHFSWGLLRGARWSLVRLSRGSSSSGGGRGLPPCIVWLCNHQIFLAATKVSHGAKLTRKVNSSYKTYTVERRVILRMMPWGTLYMQLCSCQSQRLLKAVTECGMQTMIYLLRD